MFIWPIIQHTVHHLSANVIFSVVIFSTKSSCTCSLPFLGCPTQCSHLIKQYDSCRQKTGLGFATSCFVFFIQLFPKIVAFVDIITVRNSTCGKVMFSQVSICPRGGCAPPGRQTSPPGRHTQQTAAAADGTHPTGMHSCFISCKECDRISLNIVSSSSVVCTSFSMFNKAETLGSSKNYISI